MDWIEAIARLLDHVAVIIERLWYRQRQEQRQDEADTAHDDPGSAIASHFDGKLRKLSHDTTKTDNSTD